MAIARTEDIKHLNLNLSYDNRMVEELCEDAANLNRFDCVVLSEVIEHVNHPDSFLRDSLKTLKPGGSLFITTFNKTFLSLVTAIFLVEYILKLLPKHTHEWDKFIPLDDMHKMIESRKR